MIYQDKNILITKHLIKIKRLDDEGIAVNSILNVVVKPEQDGDYKAGSVVFFILGTLAIWFIIGFVFIALGIGAYFTKKYKYVLVIELKDKQVRAIESGSKAYLSSIAQTIKGLMLSNFVN